MTSLQDFSGEVIDTDDVVCFATDTFMSTNGAATVYYAVAKMRDGRERVMAMFRELKEARDKVDELSLLLIIDPDDDNPPIRYRCDKCKTEWMVYTEDDEPVPPAPATNIQRRRFCADCGNPMRRIE